MSYSDSPSETWAKRHRSQTHLLLPPSPCPLQYWCVLSAAYSINSNSYSWTTVQMLTRICKICRLSWNLIRRRSVQFKQPWSKKICTVRTTVHMLTNICKNMPSLVKFDQFQNILTFLAKKIQTRTDNPKFVSLLPLAHCISSDISISGPEKYGNDACKREKGKNMEKKGGLRQDEKSI